MDENNDNTWQWFHSEEWVEILFWKILSQESQPAQSDQYDMIYLKSFSLQDFEKKSVQLTDRLFHIFWYFVFGLLYSSFYCLLSITWIQVRIGPINL